LSTFVKLDDYTINPLNMPTFKNYIILIFIVFISTQVNAQSTTKQWMKYEHSFISEQLYKNPIYDIKKLVVTFTSPSGRTKNINGFWDGGQNFKVRFAPDEIGEWSFKSSCSKEMDRGLHGVTGKFNCIKNDSQLAIYQRGSIQQPKGTYHLSYSDGTPFFYAGCTAWNGGLKSTVEEWDTYLQHRKDHHYSVIQFVTTQWRGADKNSLGQVAYEGAGRITVNPDFFQHLDKKVDKINEYGLIAAPVLLWALPVVQGRELNPGYVLPIDEAVLLAKYIIARYSGHQVIWMLGGDGSYRRQYEQRWLEIGRRVFDDDPPGVVTQHPQGHVWIGDNHKDEEWLDIVGYQSSHSNSQGTVDWINKGEIATRWKMLPARPVINLEPNYEEILIFRETEKYITAEDVRNASYWSLFATPIGGITYGANGIWPWIREGEKILNHRQPNILTTWRKSIDFPGSLQIGYLSEFIQKEEWWNFRPAGELLVHQPGIEQYNHFISVVRSLDQQTILAYIPHATEVQLFNPQQYNYMGQWFNPRNNEYSKASLKISDGKIRATPPETDGDFVLILRRS